MTVYHGTDPHSAHHIVNTPDYIDRFKGGGELGMGFYVGDNIALAASFAKGKFGAEGKVIEFSLNKSDFVSLDIHILKKREKVYLLWQKILSAKKRHSYQLGHDVIVAPFATIDICVQYKFESEEAEQFINASKSRIV